MNLKKKAFILVFVFVMTSLMQTQAFAASTRGSSYFSSCNLSYAKVTDGIDYGYTMISRNTPQSFIYVELRKYNASTGLWVYENSSTGSGTVNVVPGGGRFTITRAGTYKLKATFYAKDANGVNLDTPRTIEHEFTW